MQANSFWYLENIDLTNFFCPKKMKSDSIKQHIQKDYKKGEYIYVQDEFSDKIFFISEGRIKVGTYGNDEKIITKAILAQGEIFGELALINEEKRRDFAVALERTSLCILSVNDMKLMMRQHNRLQLFIMKMMGSKLIEMEHRLEGLIFKDSKTRIVEFIYKLGVKKGVKMGFDLLIKQIMTHQEIANITATSRQTVTTVLNDLRNKEILTFDRRRMLIHKMKLLAAEAGLKIA